MPTRTFDFTGGYEEFVVPETTALLTVRVEGAGANTVKGGLVTGNIPVNPGESLWVSVGQAGDPNGTVGYGGGGRGGDGRGGKARGGGGAGATVIRRGSRTGTILAVAGGAGGKSGDNGLGGAGGANAGQDGREGNSGTAKVYPAQGGTQSSPGNGGASGGGGAYAGGDAEKGDLARGGAGGQAAAAHGGGGGGGGYRAGGGGQSSAATNNPGPANDKKFPGGGGGGGSNFAHAYISGANSARGAGNEGHGRVVIEWTNRASLNLHPQPPTNVKINGQDATDEFVTKSMSGSVTISAELDDSDVGDDLRMVVYLAPAVPEGQNPVTWTFSNLVILRSPLAKQTLDDSGQETGSVTATIVINGLATNTLYRVGLQTEDQKGWVSQQSTSVSFWTNRPPNAPTLITPSENTQIEAGIDVTFTWDHSDPDGGDVQGNYLLKYRTSRTAGAPAGAWTYAVVPAASAQTRTLPASTFKSGVSYDWTVATADPEGMWGPYAVPKSFYIVGVSVPPILTYPIRGQAVQADRPQQFTWTFRDNGSGVAQVIANLRYRVVGTEDWVTLFGDTIIPGATASWTISTSTFRTGFQYEWQVQTSSSVPALSDWSESATFWAIPTPGGATGSLPVLGYTPQEPLGSGNNRAFIYLRGGQALRGEITNMTQITWERVRDATSEATVTIRDMDDSLLSLLEEVHAWTHELVIFRESPAGMQRVWEGPITYIDDRFDEWTLMAGDAMRYLERRVIRQGYNDGYQLVNGIQLGLRTVVERAELVAINALAYDDPNLLPYLTALKNPADARQSKIVPDYSKMVSQDIDEMAAKAGLDYTVAGRRIVLWDTHRPIGRLPEMRNGDFSDIPRITEYGMQFCNHYGVTDGSGVYGTAERGVVGGVPSYSTGWVEMLASAYGTDTEEVADASLLTSASRAELEATFTEQADRNIAHRYPNVYEVRVSEGTRLMPHVNLGINQLIPGVWIPIRAKSRVREVAQWQKLDKVRVVQTDDSEVISVSMNPAPNGGSDPDASVEDVP